MGSYRAPSPVNDGMGSLLSGGLCRFRVWAPNAAAVQVVLDDPQKGKRYDLAAEPETGNWSADGIPVTANQKYQYIITNRGGPNNDNSQPWLRTDARALQVESSAGASMGYIVDPALFTTQRPDFATPEFGDFLIYQLHVGSFAGLNDGVVVHEDTANFAQLVQKLDYVRGLGFNAIELLPITDAQCGIKGVGEGYGPSDMYASEDLYASSPEKAVAELVQLIDEAHTRGLAVILDVVYNHAGIGDNRYWQYDGNTAGDNGIPGGIYFVHGHHTPWGEGFATWQREVKDFLLDNARMYLRDYRVDGLRFDAVQAIPPDTVQYIVWALREEFPGKYLIAEYNPNDAGSSVAPGQDPYGALGFCATWDMGSSGDAFAFLNGINTTDLILARLGGFADPNAWHRVQYLTGSHDQIYGGQDDSGIYIAQRFGGRANGWARAKARLAWALNAMLPGTPMLFMGTEGHQDGWWDPVLGDTTDYRLDWAKLGDSLGAPMRLMVADVNRVRWEHEGVRTGEGEVAHVDSQNGVVAFKRFNNAGDVLLVVVNAGDGQWSAGDYGVNLAGDEGSYREIFNSQAAVYGGVNAPGNFGETLTPENDELWINLPCWSVLIFARQ